MTEQSNENLLNALDRVVELTPTMESILKQYNMTPGLTMAFQSFLSTLRVCEHAARRIRELEKQVPDDDWVLVPRELTSALQRHHIDKKQVRELLRKTR